ncbi:non-ribosomal peptide synthetase [Jidongwangia harbinensis]|uniref:non-ribosomal peptide synthetase n=1 Tax=Jidongwangia harbinensis TaxID=2878561 RepID=UPI001CDA3849|nr:non-ribosomal peptide synthetase [Jidongwangia harbinensis]MCA2211550.1 non-ribosomal peptide synthetase [Jidongwangia harbinensis]
MSRADLAVDRWAASTPDRVAVRDATSAVSWIELRDRVTELAARLIARHGVRAGEVVGVGCRRGVDGVVAVLAVLRAGGAFLPLDLTAPRERLAHMAGECAVRTVLVDQPSAVLDGSGADQVAVSGPGAAAGRAVFPPARLDDLAYVIYTSGSTGTPKGVLVPHRGLANLAATHADLLGIGPGDVALNYAAMTFDGFVFELFVPLHAGATIVLPDDETRLDPVRLTRLLADTGVTFAPIPPSLLAALPDVDLPALRAVLVAGDTCRLDVARRWARDRVLFNSYGPTEGTVSATLARFPGTVAELHVGAPFPGVDVHLLDDRQRPVEPGAVGEIHIGGAGVSWGYLGQPALSAERFVPDALGGTPGARLYRTGDLGRARADGGIDFLGRRDRQVKIRGVRVELGEVEAALVATPGVHEAVAVPHAEGARLVAYITAVPGGDAEPARVRAELEDRLPRSHVPDVVVPLPEMPRNAARKIDTAALPDPFGPSGTPAGEAETVPAAGDPVERVVADLVADTVGAQTVPVHTRFFDLGGNSLLMMRLVAQVNELFDAEVSVREFAAAPTVAALAAAARRTAAPERLAAVAAMAEELAGAPGIPVDAR